MSIKRDRVQLLATALRFTGLCWPQHSSLELLAVPVAQGKGGGSAALLFSGSYRARTGLGMPGFAVSAELPALQTLRSSPAAAAQPWPSSCDIPAGSGGSLCPSSVWAELRAGSTFWQVSGGVIGEEFPVAVLVRIEETEFLWPPFVPPRC